MTSAACGVSRDSIFEALAEGCPGQAFFATVPFSGGLPGEEGLTPHAPSRRALSRLEGGRLLHPKG